MADEEGDGLAALVQWIEQSEAAVADLEGIVGPRAEALDDLSSTNGSNTEILAGVRGDVETLLAHGDSQTKWWSEAQAQPPADWDAGLGAVRQRWAAAVAEMGSLETLQGSIAQSLQGYRDKTEASEKARAALADISATGPAAVSDGAERLSARADAVTSAFEALTARNESLDEMLQLLTREEEMIGTQYGEVVEVLNATSAAVDERAEVMQAHAGGGEVPDAPENTYSSSANPGVPGGDDVVDNNNNYNNDNGENEAAMSTATGASLAGGNVVDNSDEGNAYVEETKAWIATAMETMATLDEAEHEYRAPITEADNERATAAEELDSLMERHPRGTMPQGIDGDLADAHRRLDEARSTHTLASDGYAGLLAEIDALGETIEEQRESGGETADSLQSMTALITEQFSLKQQLVEAAAGMLEAIHAEIDATKPLLAAYRDKDAGGEGHIDPDSVTKRDGDGADGQGQGGDDEGDDGDSNTAAFVDWITTTAGVILEQEEEIERKEKAVKSLRALLLEEQGKLRAVRERMASAHLDEPEPEADLEVLAEAERRAAGQYDQRRSAQRSVLDDAEAHRIHESAFNHARAYARWQAEKENGDGDGDGGAQNKNDGVGDGGENGKSEGDGAPARQGPYADAGVSTMSAYTEKLTALHSANVVLLETLHDWSERLDAYTTAHTEQHTICIKLLGGARAGATSSDDDDAEGRAEMQAWFEQAEESMRGVDESIATLRAKVDADVKDLFARIDEMCAREADGGTGVASHATLVTRRAEVERQLADLARERSETDTTIANANTTRDMWTKGTLNAAVTAGEMGDAPETITDAAALFGGAFERRQAEESSLEAIAASLTQVTAARDALEKDLTTRAEKARQEEEEKATAAKVAASLAEELETAAARAAKAKETMAERVAELEAAEKENVSAAQRLVEARRAVIAVAGDLDRGLAEASDAAVDVDASDLPGLPDGDSGDPLRPATEIDPDWMLPVEQKMDLGEPWEDQVESARADVQAARRREADALSQHAQQEELHASDNNPAPSRALVAATVELAEARTAVGVALARLRQRLSFGENLMGSMAAAMEARTGALTDEVQRLRTCVSLVVAERERRTAVARERADNLTAGKTRVRNEVDSLRAEHGRAVTGASTGSISRGAIDVLRSEVAAAEAERDAQGDRYTDVMRRALEAHESSGSDEHGPVIDKHTPLSFRGDPARFEALETECESLGEKLSAADEKVSNAEASLKEASAAVDNDLGKVDPDGGDAAVDEGEAALERLGPLVVEEREASSLVVAAVAEASECAKALGGSLRALRKALGEDIRRRDAAIAALEEIVPSETEQDSPEENVEPDADQGEQEQAKDAQEEASESSPVVAEPPVPEPESEAEHAPEQEAGAGAGAGAEQPVGEPVEETEPSPEAPGVEETGTTQKGGEAENVAPAGLLTPAAAERQDSTYVSEPTTPISDISSVSEGSQQGPGSPVAPRSPNSTASGASSAGTPPAQQQDRQRLAAHDWLRRYTVSLCLAAVDMSRARMRASLVPLVIAMADAACEESEQTQATIRAAVVADRATWTRDPFAAQAARYPAITALAEREGLLGMGLTSGGRGGDGSNDDASQLLEDDLRELGYELRPEDERALARGAELETMDVYYTPRRDSFERLAQAALGKGKYDGTDGDGGDYGDGDGGGDGDGDGDGDGQGSEDGQGDGGAWDRGDGRERAYDNLYYNPASEVPVPLGELTRRAIARGEYAGIGPVPEIEDSLIPEGSPSRWSLSRAPRHPMEQRQKRARARRSDILSSIESMGLPKLPPVPVPPQSTDKTQQKPHGGAGGGGGSGSRMILFMERTGPSASPPPPLVQRNARTALLQRLAEEHGARRHRRGRPVMYHNGDGTATMRRRSSAPRSRPGAPPPASSDPLGLGLGRGRVQSAQGRLVGHGGSRRPGGGTQQAPVPPPAPRPLATAPLDPGDAMDMDQDGHAVKSREEISRESRAAYLAASVARGGAGAGNSAADVLASMGLPLMSPRQAARDPGSRASVTRRMGTALALPPKTRYWPASTFEPLETMRVEQRAVLDGALERGAAAVTRRATGGRDGRFDGPRDAGRGGAYDDGGDGDVDDGFDGSGSDESGSIDHHHLFGGPGRDPGSPEPVDERRPWGWGGRGGKGFLSSPPKPVIAGDHRTRPWTAVPSPSSQGPRTGSMRRQSARPRPRPPKSARPSDVPGHHARQRAQILRERDAVHRSPSLHPSIAAMLAPRVGDASEAENMTRHPPGPPIDDDTSADLLLGPRRGYNGGGHHQQQQQQQPPAMHRNHANVKPSEYDSQDLAQSAKWTRALAKMRGSVTVRNIATRNEKAPERRDYAWRDREVPSSAEQDDLATLQEDLHKLWDELDCPQATRGDFLGLHGDDPSVLADEISRMSHAISHLAGLGDLIDARERAEEQLEVEIAEARTNGVAAKRAVFERADSLAEAVQEGIDSLRRVCPWIQRVKWQHHPDYEKFARQRHRGENAAGHGKRPPSAASERRGATMDRMGGVLQLDRFGA